MASAYFGLNRGQTEFEVTESASTSGSTDVEVRVDSTKSLTKNEILRILDMLKNHMLKNFSTYLAE